MRYSRDTKCASTISETLLKNLWIYTDFVGLRDENCIMAYYDVPTQKICIYVVL